MSKNNCIKSGKGLGIVLICKGSECASGCSQLSLLGAVQTALVVT